MRRTCWHPLKDHWGGAEVVTIFISLCPVILFPKPASPKVVNEKYPLGGTY